MKCQDCGIIWRSPGSMNIEKKYDEGYFGSKNYPKNRRHKIKKSGWLISIARQNGNQLNSLLEIGCSVGNTLEAAKKIGLEYLGVDISQFAIDFCRNRGLNAENLSLDQLMVNGKKFDLIFMQHVLEHFQDPFHTLTLCSQILNKNGIILIVVPNAKYRRAVRRRGNHRFYNINGVGTEHFAYYEYKTLDKVLGKTGFEVVRRNYPFLLKERGSLIFFANRLYRRSLTFFNGDQEILVVARKKMKELSMV